uniref:phosphatidylglycerophosphatase A family protein n=1 Tax=Yoonia sp. TaxID=2212373 RepID=UPI0040481903|tara:strand:+ start:500 stop:988 length:489 start_codon:yes stop_codon:yes gene_type:complete
MSKLIATFFYVGHIRPAPGTWGSLAALPVAWVLITYTGLYGLIFASGVAYALGLWATKVETAGTDNHDPSEIVIDEVVGQWIALLPIASIVSSRGLDALALWPGWIVAFALFRLFDITKPWLVGWADRRDDATGVMLDDVIAGIFAALGVLVLGGLYHAVFV